MMTELLYDAIHAIPPGEFPPEPAAVAAARKARADLFERLPLRAPHKRDDRRALAHYERIIDGYNTLVIERAADLGLVDPKDYSDVNPQGAASGAAR